MAIDNKLDDIEEFQGQDKEKRPLYKHKRQPTKDNGSVPKFPIYIARVKDASGINPKVVTYHDSKSVIAEQYRIIRTNIQRIDSDNPPKIIGITSSLHQEGKSTTAINLSVIFAKDLSKRILIVDADLRKPTIHKLLGIKPSIGLAQVLAGKVDYHEAIQQVNIENLSILSCGKIPHNPSELLGSLEMTNLIEQLRKDFDYVIFDTPPVIAITDSGVLSAQLDGVILVIQAWRTQRETVIRSQNLLATAKANLLGFVLTNVEHFIPKYLSYYGYGYQYGSYQY